MSISAISGMGVAPPSTEKNQNRQNLLGSSFAKMLGGTSSKAEGLSTQNDSAVQEFNEYMKKSPAERMLETWLKQHGLTKEQFDKLSPEEKQKLMAQMKQEIEARVREKAEGASRVQLDIMA